MSCLMTAVPRCHNGYGGEGAWGACGERRGRAHGGPAGCVGHDHAGRAMLGEWKAGPRPMWGALGGRRAPGAQAHRSFGALAAKVTGGGGIFYMSSLCLLVLSHPVDMSSLCLRTAALAAKPFSIPPRLHRSLAIERPARRRPRPTRPRWGATPPVCST
jgi:hypothetical protein